MWGLEHSSHFNGIRTPQKTVAARIARYSYGISCRTSFETAVHKLEDRVWSDAHDEYRADVYSLFIDLLKQLIRFLHLFCLARVL